ncbi:MAG: FliM/FliN family flagellar motor switch protein [Terriglobia bacterium]
METTDSKTEAQPAAVPQSEDPWEAASGLPCQLSVALPVIGFRVRDLLDLKIDTVVDSRQSASNAVPVWVNGVRIGEAEFDVFGNRLAIRINELG